MRTAERSDGLEHGCNLDELVHADPAAPEHLARLREACAESLPSSGKLVITALEGSSIERQFPILERYLTEIEACTSTYVRQRVTGGWNADSDPRVRGSLEPRDDAPGHRYTEIRM